MNNPFGETFGEGIIREGKMRKMPFSAVEDSGVSPVPVRFLAVILLLGLGILLTRLIYLCVVNGSWYRHLAEGNRIREVKITAPRGIIYDRKGIPLVRNIPVFAGSDGTMYFEQVATPAMNLTEKIARQYLFGSAFAHVVGFVGEIGGDELKTQRVTNVLPKTDNHIYESGDIVGKLGVERTYDEILRGVDGRQLSEVDATGRPIRLLGSIAPAAGKNITLTLDSDLQSAAAQEMAGKKGAVVVSNPLNGEILALYSSPSFDPNLFIRQESGVSQILSDTNQPLFDRTISGTYPPGSTFKIVIALAGLESGKITPETKFEDTGILHVGSFSFSNWYFTQYGKKDGLVDIVKAIERSNDIFFYKAGEAIGIDNLAVWARKAGIGKLTGIDLDNEAAGLMPDIEWKEKNKGEDWYLGDTYHVSIGQGDVSTTPLQMNFWTNIIASGGKLCRPHLTSLQSTVYGLQSSDKSHQSTVYGLRIKDKNIDNNFCTNLGVHEETINLIREGLVGACSTGGTGWPLFNFKVPVSPAGRQSSKINIDGIDFLEPTDASASAKNMVEIPTACKTGTAEYGDPKNNTHAWFTVFAPVHKPQISVTVLVEGGGEGSNVAAPIAKKILEKWFTK
jgi:penicillin-binding protein 2